jgi:hypothetical protein
MAYYSVLTPPPSPDTIRPSLTCPHSPSTDTIRPSLTCPHSPSTDTIRPSLTCPDSLLSTRPYPEFPLSTAPWFSFLLAKAAVAMHFYWWPLPMSSRSAHPPYTVYCHMYGVSPFPTNTRTSFCSLPITSCTILAHSSAVKSSLRAQTLCHYPCKRSISYCTGLLPYTFIEPYSHPLPAYFVSFSYLLLRPFVYRLQLPPSPSCLLSLCSILIPTSFTCVQSLLLLPPPVYTPYSCLFLPLGHVLTPTVVSPCSFLFLFPVINPYPLTEGTTTWPNPFLFIHNLYSYPLLLHMFNITTDRTPI